MHIRVIKVIIFYALVTLPVFAIAQQYTNRIAFLNASLLVGERGDQYSVLELNDYIKKFSQANNIQLVIQEAAYVHPSIDISGDIVTLTKKDSGLSSLNLKKQLPEIRVAVINTARFFKEAEIAKKNNQELQREFSSEENRLRKMAQNLKNDAKDFDAESNKLTEAESTKRKKDLRLRDEILLAEQQKFTKNVNSRASEERAKIASMVNPLIKQIAQKYNLHLVIQEGAYVDSNIDITDSLIKFSDTKDIRDVGDLYLSGKPARISLVNPVKIYNSFSEIPRDKLRISANDAIKQYARSNGIDLVLQSAVYLTPSIDITSSVIQIMKLDSQGLSNSKILEYKNKCKDLGFKEGTEGFGKCILQLSK